MILGGTINVLRFSVTKIFVPSVESGTSEKVLNNINNSRASFQIMLFLVTMILDSKLTFQEHYKTILSKTNRTTGLLRKLQNLLRREALFTKLLFDPSQLR